MDVFDGIDAAMDEPFHLMYDDVMVNFPDAKLLASLRGVLQTKEGLLT